MNQASPNRTQRAEAPAVVGIVGGIASGKSSVAQMFGQLGARIVDADRVGHDLLSEPDVVDRARERWGPSVVDGQGRLDRGQIAARVFDQSPQGCADRAFWEDVLHPRIRRTFQAEMRRAAHDGATVVVLDAALLLEAGWAQDCEAIVFVDVPASIRQARARSRGWSEAVWRARESAQWDLDQKRRMADFVIDNSGQSSQTYEQVLYVWKRFSRRTQ